MCPANQVHIMLLQETRHNVRAERKGDSTIVFAPPRDIFVRVRPQQITEETAIRNLKKSADHHGRCFLPGSCEGLITTTQVSLTSVGRMTRRICSMEFRSGLSPPCMVNIFSSMMAAIGKQLKQSVKVFHSLILYRLLHSS